ncbi:ankyrin repeat protein, partial [Biomphalaria pfeifferi]
IPKYVKMSTDASSSEDSFLIQAVSSRAPDKIYAAAYNLLFNKNLYSQRVLDYCLLRSSKNGHIVLVRSLLAAGANLETRDGKQNTPLLLSVLNNQLRITSLLLQKGADLNASNSDGDTALILSTLYTASYSTTQLLLNQTCINKEHRNSSGFTALESAIKVFNLEAIKLLIDVKVSMPFYDKHSIFSLLNQSSSNQHENSIKNGILNVVKYFKSEKETGKQALITAAAKRDSRAVHLIVSMDNAVLNYTKNTYLQAIVQILESLVNATVCDDDINTVRLLTQNYLLIHHNYGDKVLENLAVESAVSVGNNVILQLLCESKFFISNAIVGSLAERGATSLLQILIKHGANVNNDSKIIRYQGSALERAMLKEQFDCVKLLVNAGAVLNIYDALEMAVQSNKQKTVEFLFGSFSESIDAKVFSSNLLHLAVSHENTDIIKMLLDKGFNVNLQCEDKTPLMLAANPAIIDLLVSRGADVNATIAQNRNTRKVLHYIVSGAFKKYLRSKFSKKSNRWINMCHATIVELFIHHGASIIEKDYNSRTPFLIAAETSDSKYVMMVLLEAGANLDERMLSGCNALHVAVQSCRKENVAFLLKRGADINSCNIFGQNALFMCEDDEVMKLLLSSNADVNAVDTDGNNALMFHLIKWSYDFDIVKELIAASDVNHKRKDGKTPLLLAAKRLEADVISLLIHKGADVNYTVVRNGENISAFTITVSYVWNQSKEAMDCLNILLDHGLNTSCIPSYFIHSLISVGCFSLVTRLISLGIAPSVIELETSVSAWVRTKYIFSPLDSAMLVQNSHLAQFLVDIRFLTPKDLHLLSGDPESKEFIVSERNESLGYQSFRQPLSLETLTFVAASQLFGHGHDRVNKICQSGLPKPLQEALMFQKVSHDQGLKDDFNRKNLLLFKTAFNHAKLKPRGDGYFNRMYGSIRIGLGEN